MRTRTPAGSALALLVALVVLGVEAPEVHEHDGLTPGLYNAECSLERLAAWSGGAAVPDTTVVTPPVPAVPLHVTPAAPAPLALPLAPASARAPPPLG